MRRWLIVGTAILAAVVLVVVVDGDDPDPAPPTTPSASVEPVSWRIVYRVEESGAVVTTERVWVRRPFESRLEVWAGEPPGTERQLLQVAALGRLLQQGGDSVPIVLAVPPGAAASDVRLGPGLTDALAAGVVVSSGQTEVAGRPADCYRTRAPLAAGPLGPPLEDEFAETCIGTDGLVLSERYVLTGETVSSRIAVEVEVDPELDNELFAIGDPTAPVDQGGGSVRPVDAGHGAVGEFWELPDDAVPDGFEALGRYGVIPPQPQNFTDPERRPHIIASTVDVWTSGADLLLVDQGATLGGVDPYAVDPVAAAIALGALGDGEARPGGQLNEVRARRPNGGYVRVAGTLPIADLAAVARGLVATEGDGLVYLD